MRLVPILFLLGGLAIGCDVFIEDIGHKGEKCSGDDLCYGELVCQQDVCVERLEEGEDCHLNGYYSSWYDEAEDPCEEDLLCVEGTCSGPDSNEITQPDSSLVWLRCPLGTTWTGWVCEGE